MFELPARSRPLLHELSRRCQPSRRIAPIAKVRREAEGWREGGDVSQQLFCGMESGTPGAGGGGHSPPEKQAMKRGHAMPCGKKMWLEGWSERARERAA